MKKGVLIGGIVIAALMLAFGASFALDKGVTWTPGQVSATAVSGKASTSTVVSFASDKTLYNVDVRIDPALQPYLSVTPSSLSKVNKDQPVALTLTFAASSTTSPQSLSGAITLYKDNGASKVLGPLPVALVIELPQLVENDISFKYPGTWQVDPTPRDLGKAIELINFSSWLDGGIVPPGGASIVVSQFSRSEPLQAVIDEDMIGQTVRQVSNVTVGGEAAAKVESTIDFGNLMEDRVTVFVPHNQSLYKFILMYHSGESGASGFVDALSQVLDTTIFN